jgi:hypothetical protein
MPCNQETLSTIWQRRARYIPSVDRSKPCPLALKKKEIVLPLPPFFCDARKICFMIVALPATGFPFIHNIHDELVEKPDRAISCTLVSRRSTRRYAIGL